MATPPTSSNVKVTLRATPAGARVIQRLELPNIDKSAELRRLIELGFAAELAGFTLDGTVLRFGGRVWDMRNEVGQVVAGSPEPVAPVEPTATGSRASQDATAGAVSQTGEPAHESNTLTASVGSGSLASEAQGRSELLTNLRGLAGGR
jgi:hypothetical protein